MITPEESDKELAKLLQTKFEGFKGPVKDQIGSQVFAALTSSSRKTIYRAVTVSALVVLISLLMGYLFWSNRAKHTLPASVSSKKNPDNTRKQTKKPTVKKPESASLVITLPNLIAENLAARNVKIQGNKANARRDNSQNANYPKTRQKHSIPLLSNTDLTNCELNSVYNTSDNSAARPDRNNIEVHTISTSAEKEVALAFLSSIDSVNLAISKAASTLPMVAEYASGDLHKKPVVKYSIKGIFSIGVMQTLQLVNLSQSSVGRLQNFRFAPLLSSKSLSYKLTAGLEKRNTQLLFSYAYFRNWNEYEIGTNQVVAVRNDANQYRMLRIGENHIEDDRSHLIGIGLRQNIKIPQNIMKNYTINLGMEYTRLLPDGQNLLWGNLGFSKQVYHNDKIQIDAGPYVQYSFIERKVEAQSWKFRPYQIGISLGVKLK